MKTLAEEIRWTALPRVAPICLIVACLGSGAIGCTINNSKTDDSVSHRSATQEASVWTEAPLWSESIDVCFRNNGGYCRNRCTLTSSECSTDANCGTGETCRTERRCEDNLTACTLDSQCDANPVGATAYADAKDLVEEAIVTAWQHPSGLVFDFNGDCGASPNADWLVLNLTNSGWGGSCGMGNGVDCQFGILNRGRIQDVAVHEVGHALGLPHEQKRLDADVCASLAEQVEGCDDCAQGTCTETHFEACFGGNVTGVQTPTTQQRNAANNVLWNSGPDARAAGLTKFDPRSIMNYCRQADFSLTNPSLTDWRPTRLDSLGIEILYPKANPIRLGCERGCIQIDGGVVVRTDGHIADEWTYRGALPWWEAAAPPVWQAGTNTVAASPSVAAAQLGGSGSVTMTAVSRWNGTTIVATGAATVSDAQWTAIAISTL